MGTPPIFPREHPAMLRDTAREEVNKYTDSVIPIPRCSKLKYKGRVYKISQCRRARQGED